MESHKIKVKEQGVFVITKGRWNELFLFDEEGWENVCEIMLEQSLDDRQKEVFRRFIVRDAMQVEVEDDLEVELPGRLWEYLTERKKDVQICVKKPEPLSRGGHTIYEQVQWIIQAIEV